MTARSGFVTWAGLAVVLAAAAVLSFSGLAGLAEMVGIHQEIGALRLAWLLPVCTDAGVAVATAVWLSRRHNADAERFAQQLTWALLVLTVVGNATHQGFAAAEARPAWWVAVLVGAIPPAVVGAVVHLAVLVGRTRTEDSTKRKPQHLPADRPPAEVSPAPPPDPSPEPSPVPPPVEDRATAPPPAPPTGLQEQVVGDLQETHLPELEESWEQIAWRLLEEDAGRSRLVEELGISEHHARLVRKTGISREEAWEILSRARVNGGRPTAG